MVVNEVTEILSFDQTNWLTPYIVFNTEKQQGAKNAFEKDFFKLMNNSIYGKSMENVRKYQDVKLMKMNNEQDEKAFLNKIRFSLSSSATSTCQYSEAKSIEVNHFDPPSLSIILLINGRG